MKAEATHWFSVDILIHHWKNNLPILEGTADCVIFKDRAY
jgi:hypothetical protein